MLRRVLGKRGRSQVDDVILHRNKPPPVLQEHSLSSTPHSDAPETLLLFPRDLASIESPATPHTTNFSRHPKLAQRNGVILATHKHPLYPPTLNLFRAPTHEPRDEIYKNHREKTQGGALFKSSGSTSTHNKNIVLGETVSKTNTSKRNIALKRHVKKYTCAEYENVHPRNLEVLTLQTITP